MKVKKGPITSMNEEAEEWLDEKLTSISIRVEDLAKD